MIKINENSWHARYYHWLSERYDLYRVQHNICGYTQTIIWGTLGLILFLPFTIIGLIVAPIFEALQFGNKQYNTINGVLTTMIMCLISSVLIFLNTTWCLTQTLSWPFSAQEFKIAFETITNKNAILVLGTLFGGGLVIVPIIVFILHILFKTCAKVEFKE